MTMERRHFCSVPGCRRYMRESTVLKRWGSPNVVFICGDHWRRLTKRERSIWARLKRTARRFGWEAIGPRSDRIWSALRRRAGEE
jgi:hypothetical protein